MMAETGQRKVVIAMDGSDHANYALDWYMENVRKADDHVILVHCPEYHALMQSPTFGMGELTLESDLAEDLALESKRINGLIAHLEDKLKTLKISGTVKRVNGVPGEVIVRVADDEKASVIIAGTRGLGTIRRTLMGSVSDYIMHHSHVPVIVCRHKDHHHHHHS